MAKSPEVAPSSRWLACWRLALGAPAHALPLSFSVFTNPHFFC